MATREQVISAARQKWPQYQGVPDDKLYAALIAKFPEYAAEEPAPAEPAQPSAPAGYDAAYPRLPLGVSMDPTTPEGKANAGMMTAASVIGSGGIIPFLQALGKSAVGAGAGRWIGREAGGLVGFPEAGQTIGGVVGGIGGPFVGKDALLSALGSRGGLLGPTLRRLIGGADEAVAAAAPKAAGAADEIAALKAKEIEQRIADRVAKAARDAERHELQKEILKARLEGRAAPRAPKPKQPTQTPPAPTKEATAAEILPDEAVSVVADPIPEPTVLPAGQRAMATNLGGAAKAGPEPTPAVDLEDVLRRSIEAAKAKKAGAASPLRGPRLEIGAERVGKGAGMTKEQVRLETGPRLDEALGEASPILPDVPLQKIIDTMKALPKTGGAREAYVARATSGKTKWQVENIRRTLEHLGLLVPAGVAAGAMSE